MTPKKILIFSSIASFAILIMTEPVFDLINKGYFIDFEPVLLAPLFFTLLSYFTSSLILLFFSNKIFQLWLRRVVSWFLPISIIFIWFGSGGNDFVAPSETDVAILMGYLLTGITLTFALVQKFYYHR
jgi:hypothetical protein